MFGRQNHLKLLAPLALWTMIFSSGAWGGNLKKVWPYISWQHGVASSIKLQCKNCSTNFPRYFFRTFIQSFVKTPKTLPYLKVSQWKYFVTVYVHVTSRRKTISSIFLVIYTLQRKLYKYHRFNSVEKRYMFIFI